MSETTDAAAAPAGAPEAGAPKKRGGLSTMLLADLKAMAGGMGIAGAGGMKKAQLVTAIREAQSGPSAPSGPAGSDSGSGSDGGSSSAPVVTRRQRGRAVAAASERPEPAGESSPAAQQSQGPEQQQRARADAERPDRQDRRQDAQDQRPQRQQGQQQGQQKQRAQDQKQQDQKQQDQKQQDQKQQDQKQQDQKQQDQKQQDQKQQDRGGQQQGQQPAQQRQQDQQQDLDDDGGSRRNRRRRGRDRERPVERAGRAAGRGEPDTTVLDDDVLVPAAGILDVLDNYAFVRTSGYLPGPDDVYVSLSIVRKYGLRRGDAVVGQVRQPREGERREKFNPMVRIDSVNGAEPDTARSRPELTSLTPVHPTERLRLETSAGDVVGRVLDLVTPIGKGQRALVAAPAGAGSSALLQAVAASVTRNNPECHLMVLLVDQRPEEVTDVERAVKGEVIASTFDRPPADHTTVAELAVERAKRLVELGHDVVLLVDGLGRLARAYNLAASGSGRVLPGGVDASALHPPKRFFGAARNVENGGSLTMVATAVVESGSTVDQVLFEELEGTSNAEVRLRRDLAEQGVFPAVDVHRSGTRRDELLVSEQEAALLQALRRTLADLAPREALEELRRRVSGSQSNVELLTRVQRAAREG